MNYLSIFITDRQIDGEKDKRIETVRERRDLESSQHFYYRQTDRQRERQTEREDRIQKDREQRQRLQQTQSSDRYRQSEREKERGEI